MMHPVIWDAVKGVIQDSYISETSALKNRRHPGWSYEWNYETRKCLFLKENNKV